MKQKSRLPLPFLILILAGVVSIYSILASRSSGAAMVQDNSMQMQTVEQERMAAVYFRVLSWLSDVTPRKVEPLQANPQPASVSHDAKTPRRSECPAIIELCTFHPTWNHSASKFHTRNLN
jgi:hypothetical protein